MFRAKISRCCCSKLFSVAERHFSITLIVIVEASASGPLAIHRKSLAAFRTTGLKRPLIHDFQLLSLFLLQPFFQLRL